MLPPVAAPLRTDASDAETPSLGGNIVFSGELGA